MHEKAQADQADRIDGGGAKPYAAIPVAPLAQDVAAERLRQLAEQLRSPAPGPADQADADTVVEIEPLVGWPQVPTAAAARADSTARSASEMRLADLIARRQTEIDRRHLRTLAEEEFPLSAPRGISPPPPVALTERKAPPPPPLGRVPTPDLYPDPVTRPEPTRSQSDLGQLEPPGPWPPPPASSGAEVSQPAVHHDRAPIVIEKALVDMGMATASPRSDRPAAPQSGLPGFLFGFATAIAIAMALFMLWP